MEKSKLSFKELAIILSLVCGLAVTWGTTAQRLDEHETRLNDLKPIPEHLAAMRESLNQLKDDVRALRTERYRGRTSSP